MMCFAKPYAMCSMGVTANILSMTILKDSATFMGRNMIQLSKPFVPSMVAQSFQLLAIVRPVTTHALTSNMQTATTGLIPSRLTPHLLMKRAVSSFVKRTQIHVYITFTKKGNPKQSVNYLLMKKELV